VIAGVTVAADLIPQVTASRRGIDLALAGVKRDLLDDLEAYGLAAAIGGDRIYHRLLLWHPP